MNTRWRINSSILTFVPILLGACAFFLITGGKILSPAYSDWLMEGDPATSWIGWQFFRHTPLLQWPLGANPNYGMEMASSIVFTDSIPLLAFIFKPLSPLLPSTFQYFGLWILICFSFQTFFAWKLLALFTQNKRLPIIGSLFFTIAPVCLERCINPNCCHYVLFGQWVLLAGLYLYFSKNFSKFYWLVLLGTTTLIHAYLTAMLIAIWLADLAQRLLLKETNVAKTIIYFLTGGLTVGFILWASGYFMIGSAGSLKMEGFGLYRMNLLSLVDSDGIWSQLLVDQKSRAGDYEGFCYLGLGMIGLAGIASYKLLSTRKIDFKIKIIPICIITIGFFIFAISNHIAFGDHELLSYSVPSIVNIFRASGRFCWPICYIIYLAIFYIIFTQVNQRIALLACALALLIQVADFTQVWHAFKSKFNNSPKWSSPMQASLWSQLAQQYKKIIFVLPENISENWMPLSKFAATHHMSINTGYFARVNRKKIYAARKQLTIDILNNKLNPDCFYIFGDTGLWNIASYQVNPTDAIGVLNGFRIIAPNLKSLQNYDINELQKSPRGILYNMERIYCSTNGTAQKYLLVGWSTPETHITWSDGNVAFIQLNLANIPNNNLELLIEGQAFITDQLPDQEVDISVNNQHVSTLHYNRQCNEGVRVVKIPRALALKSDGKLLVKFNFKNAKSPAELNLSADNRQLALGIMSFQLKEEN